MFKGGSRLFISLLMMKLAIGSNKELMCMLMHIIRVGFKRAQSSKNGLYHFPLVVLLRISP